MANDLVPYIDPTAFLGAVEQIISAKSSTHTRIAYQRDVQLWVQYCQSNGVDPACATLQHAANFRNTLSAKYAPGSVSRALSSISSVYETIVSTGALRVNPFRRNLIGRPPATEFSPTVLVEPAAVEAMVALAEAKSLRDATILLILYETGLRRSSVALLPRLPKEDLGDSLVYMVRVKGDRTEPVSLPTRSRDHVLRWLEQTRGNPSEHLFPGRTLGPKSHIGLSTMSALISEYAAAAGVPEVHPHSFRAAFITNAYDAGIPQDRIQAAVHHKNPTMTQRYDRRRARRGLGVGTELAEFRKGDVK